MNLHPYLIPMASVRFEEEIKKSLFITYLAHTPDLASAKAFVDEIKQRHADARHNCWAFVAGRPENSMLWGLSDDGEPSGTAGKPILAQLTGSHIGEITAVSDPLLWRCSIGNRWLSESVWWRCATSAQATSNY
ncbi:hypothetical protein VCSRO48_2785 [Vibrio cholerae]|nr:hypothetical protein DN37_1867 [Vibrio cholerae]GIB77341.1 hypothetical protein VCSRO48_2785 [Vibrio cholerae]